MVFQQQKSLLQLLHSYGFLPIWILSNICHEIGFSFTLSIKVFVVVQHQIGPSLTSFIEVYVKKICFGPISQHYNIADITYVFKKNWILVLSAKQLLQHSRHYIVYRKKLGFGPINQQYNIADITYVLKKNCILLPIIISYKDIYIDR